MGFFLTLLRWCRSALQVWLLKCTRFQTFNHRGSVQQSFSKSLCRAARNVINNLNTVRDFRLLSLVCCSSYFILTNAKMTLWYGWLVGQSPLSAAPLRVLESFSLMLRCLAQSHSSHQDLPMCPCCGHSWSHCSKVAKNSYWRFTI